MKFCEASLLLLFCAIPSLDAVLVGGQEPLDISDPKVISLSQVALVKLNENKGVGGSQKELIEILSATRQIVSGTLTRLTLKVSESGVETICEAKIWEQPWLNKTEITFSECDNNVEKHDSEKRDRSRRQADEEQNFLLQSFDEFIKTNRKVYKDEKEYKKRFRIFRANLKKIKILRKNELGTAQYGLTWFTDLTAKEFKRYLGVKKPKKVERLPMAEIPNINLPDEFDWRYYNVVTPVKNQKFCGSCWAFSVTGNIEGQWALKNNELLSLSEQELIDCDKSDNGCEGGYMTNAYSAIMKLGGLETESDYPYTAKDNVCHLNKREVKVIISGAVNITNSETKMAQWLVKNGPISVALNANVMQFYFGGVSHPSKFLCSHDDLNHGVLIVGFGVHHSTILKRTLPYWIIKNSWGPRWGERGYYRLYRGDGSCGINQMVSSAIVN